MAKSPMMYYDGSKWRYWQCYNQRQANKAIFVGGGPSLAKLDHSKIPGPGKTVFGVNNTYPLVRPDYWIGMDDPRCYNRHVFYEAFPKIMRGGYQDRKIEDGTVMKDLTNMYFASCEESKPKEDLFNRIDNLTEKYVWKKNIFAITINIMLHMGYRDIYLAGVDFENTSMDYFNGVTISDDERRWNAKLYSELNHYLQWLVKTGKMAGINFYSISPDSPINEFTPYISLEELNDSITLPELGKLYHSKEVP